MVRVACHCGRLQVGQVRFRLTGALVVQHVFSNVRAFVLVLKLVSFSDTRFE